MPDIRENPTTVREKSAKPKERISGKAVHAAGRQITAKYRKELAQHDERNSDNQTETEAAVGCTTQAAGKVVSQSIHVMRGTAVKAASQIKTQRAVSQKNGTSVNIPQPVARQTAQQPQEKMQRFVVQKYRKKYRMARQEKLNELRIPRKAMATEPVECVRKTL